MPRDISSSSSEDETDSVPAEKQNLKESESVKKSTRYQCPADFVSFCHKPCRSTLTKSLKNKNTELWLIKAPASFNPEHFSSIKVPLSGLHTLKTPSAAEGVKTGSGQQIFSILASSHGTSDLHLLTGDKHSSNSTILAPAFSGLLNVCESYGDTSAHLAPQVIPAAPVPSIPPGLKQRFQPFGSKTPTLTCVAKNEVDGAACGPSSTNLQPRVVKRFIDETEHEEEVVERKKKKKKKKEKQMETDQAEVPDVKVEPEGEILTEPLILESEIKVESRKKKKKKKKDRDREEVEEGVEPSVKVKEEELMVKCEPTDTTYGDEVEGLGKKKKKKKKSKTHDE